MGKLYLPGRARYFGCWDCHDLTYRSCQESGKHNLLFAMMAEGTGCSLQEVKRAMRELERQST